MTTSAPGSPTFSTPVKILHKQWKRPFDVIKIVPSLGTLLFQGPRKILQKVLLRLERHRQPFDEAMVMATSTHDKRLTELERSITALHEQNAALLRTMSPAPKQIAE